MTEHNGTELQSTNNKPSYHTKSCKMSRDTDTLKTVKSGMDFIRVK